MAGNSRLVLVNLATASTVVLKNGTGGGAPATEQDTAYPMTNALQGDRYTPWKTSGTVGTTVNFDLDLGISATPLTCAWVNAIHYADPTKDLTTVTVSGHATTYSGTATGYTPLGTITIPAVTAEGATPRDAGVVFGSTSIRYLRFAFAARGSAGVFSVGKLGVGAYVDLLGYYAPQSTDSPLRYQTISRAIGGFPEILDYGREGREIKIMWPTAAAGDAADTNFPKLTRLHGAFTYIDPADIFYEVRLQDSKVTRTRVFTNLNGYEVPLERLP